MDDALKLICRAGVVGGGGAGFPTWKKLSVHAEYLLINGAECEPLLRSDQYLMLHEAETLVRAADAMGKLIGAQAVVIALKDHYTRQKEALERAIARSGLRVSLHLLRTVYPIGDEQAIVHACTGRTVPPTGLPGQVGCMVVSVSTSLNVWHALHGMPVTRRLVTVAGEVKAPGLYDVPVGASVRDVIAAAGGFTVRAPRILLGGPMMGTLVGEEEEPVVTKTCGGILAFATAHPLIRQAERSLWHMKNQAKSACIRCRACTDLCPRYLLGHPNAPHQVMLAFAMGKTEPAALLCMECGICELYACPMRLSPCRIQQAMKADLRKEGAQPDRTLHPERAALLPYRQLPSERLISRIGIRPYDMQLPEATVPVCVSRVRIPLRQHIGVPAKAIVSPGDAVRTGQCVARMEEGALGADIHASIDGRVVSVGDRIEIRAEE